MRGIELDCGDVRRTCTDGGRRRGRSRPGPAERLHQRDVGGAEPIDLARWKGIEERVGAYIGDPIAEVASRELPVVVGRPVGYPAFDLKRFGVIGASLIYSRNGVT